MNLKRTKMKEEIQNLKVIIKKKEKEKKEHVQLTWIFKILFLAFLISFSFSFVSEMTLPNVSIYIGIPLVILFILLGILFDMIGVAVTASDEKIFHSMSSRKVYGARLAVVFKKNADKVASFCNDVIGDICGVISGSAGVVIATRLAEIFSIDGFFLNLIVTALIASFTIGGKALGKSFAINQSNLILYRFAKILTPFYHRK